MTSITFMTGTGELKAKRLDKIDCSADMTLLGHVRVGPTAKNIEHNWIEDELDDLTKYRNYGEKRAMIVDYDREIGLLEKEIVERRQWMKGYIIDHGTALTNFPDVLGAWGVTVEIGQHIAGLKELLSILKEMKDAA